MDCFSIMATSLRISSIILLFAGFAILCLSHFTIKAEEPQLLKAFKVQDGKFVEKDTGKEANVKLEPRKKDDDDADDDESAKDDASESEDETSDKPKISHVVILGKENFTHVIGDYKHVLVEFYAPWCGHCQQMEPEYEKLATELKENGSDIVIAKVDATVEKDLADEFNINGFPTLKLFNDGNREMPYDIEGVRTKTGIWKKLKKMTNPNYVPPVSDVVTLDKLIFDDFVNHHKISLVEFYAPWCGHCKSLAPEYERAANLLKKNYEIPLAKIDATKEVELANKYAVTGYPTLIIFRHGKHYKVSKPVRQSYELEELMIEEKDPVSKEITSLRDFKIELDNNDETLVGLFKAEDKESDVHKVYMESSYDYRNILPIKHTYDPKVVEYVGAEKTPAIVLYTPKKFQSKLEPRIRALTEVNNSEELKEFFDSSRFPLIGEYKKGERYDSKKPLLIVFYAVDFVDHYEETQFWRQRMLPLAKKYKGKLTFSVGDDETFADLMKEAGLGDSGNDINAVIYSEDGLRYPMSYEDDDFSVALLGEFVEEYFAGKVEPHVRSEKPPRRQKNAVVTVVAKTFKDIVFSETQDVIIELYAPWCGHCKSLAPIYEEFAQSMKDDKQLIVAKMDATANDLLKDYSAEGYPTIYWRSRGKNSQPEKYTGDRTLEGLTKFVKLQREGYKIVDDVKDEL